MAKLERLGLLDATMIIMGSMIGSGIFLAPALVAGIAVGSRLGAGTFVLVWIVGGMLTVCAALSFGELASSLPRTGGQYVYLSKAFSPFLGLPVRLDAVHGHPDRLHRGGGRGVCQLPGRVRSLGRAVPYPDRPGDVPRLHGSVRGRGADCRAHLVELTRPESARVRFLECRHVRGREDS